MIWNSTLPTEPVHTACPGKVASLKTKITPHYLYDVGKKQLHTVTQYWNSYITTNLVPRAKKWAFDCLTRFIINSYTKRGNSKMKMQMSILKCVGLQHFFCHYMTKTYSNLRGHKKLPMYLDFIQFTTEPNSDINLCLHSTASSCCYFWEMAYLGLTDLVYGLKEMDTVVKKWLCWYTF